MRFNRFWIALDKMDDKIKNEIKNAIAVMKNGGVILYPTDTIWGIGCDATNPDAVAKIYDIKHRSESKSMIVLVDSLFRAQNYVNELPDIAWDLVPIADKPLTIIYDGAKNLAHNLIAEDGSIAIRVTSETFSAELCNRFAKPIVSTSANISGNPAPHFFAEIDPQIINAVDYVVDYRRDDNKSATPSSIIKLGVNGTVKVIR